MNPKRKAHAQRIIIASVLIIVVIGSIVLTAWLYRSALPAGYTQAAAIFVALGSGVLMGMALETYTTTRYQERGYLIGYTVGYRQAEQDLATEQKTTAAERAAEMRKIVEDIYK